MFLYSCSPQPKNQNSKILVDSQERTDSISAIAPEQVDVNSEEELERKGVNKETTTKQTSAFQPEFINIQVDTSQLFGIWTQDPTGPHADFWLTDKSYYIVDSEDGDLNYVLEGKIFKILSSDGEYSYEIISTKNDSLVMANTEYGVEFIYTRWKN